MGNVSRKPYPVNKGWEPKKESMGQREGARRRKAAIAADPDIPAEEKIEVVVSKNSGQHQKWSKGSSRPPEVSERIWNIAGAFIDYGWEHKKDLGLDKDELKIRRDRLAQGINSFINAEEPAEFLATLQKKFPATKDYFAALDWMLDKAIWIYWERWSEDEQGFHQVRFVDYLDGLLRRAYDLYQHHLWNLQGRPEMPRTVQGGSQAELAELERQDGERRLRSHFGGAYPGYGMQVDDDLLLALPGVPTNEGDETQ